MTTYRVDLLNGEGRVESSVLLDCAEDDDAIDRVGDLDHPEGMEIWQGARHVASFPPWRAEA